MYLHLHDTIVFVVGFTLVFRHTCFLRRSVRWHGFHQRLHESLVNMWATLRKSRGNDASCDAFTLRVTAVLQAQLASRAERYIFVAACLFHVLVVCRIVTCFTGPGFASLRIDLSLMLTSAILAFLCSNHQFYRKSMIDIWCCAFMSLMILNVTPGSVSKERLPIMNMGQMIFRLVTSRTTLNLPLIVIMNVCYLVASVTSYVLATSNCAVEGSLHLTYIEAFVYVGAEFLAFACLIVAFVFDKVSSLADAHREVESTNSKQEASAVIGLLNAMCDAVVQLNDDLTITEHSPPLAGMLLHGSDRSLVGTLFVQLLAADRDKTQFHNNMTKISDGNAGCMANVFHVQMRDSMSTAMNVQIFHVRFATGFEGYRHLIGVREHGDAENHQHTYNNDLTNSVSDTTSLSSFSEISSSVNARNGSCKEDTGQTVIFNALTFEIITCSNEFSVQYGPVGPNTVFTELLSSDSRNRDFLSRYTNSVNESLNQKGSLAGVPRSFPSSRCIFKNNSGSTVELSCRLWLSTPQALGIMDSAAETVARIVLNPAPLSRSQNSAALSSSSRVCDNRSESVTTIVPTAKVPGKPTSPGRIDNGFSL